MFSTILEFEFKLAFNVSPASVPTEVMFGCAAVVNVPTIFVAPMLPTLASPETDNVPVIDTVFDVGLNVKLELP